MSHIPELRFGMAGYPAIDASGRAPLESSPFDPSGYAPGVPVSMMRSFRITPLALQAANVAASQTPAGAGALTLTAGTGATSAQITINGQLINVIDITGGTFSRSLRIVGQVGVTQRNYTITGYDEYNQLQTLVIAGPSGNQTIETAKTWRYIQSISVSGGTTAAITIGTGDTFGLPIVVDAFDRFVNLFWNGAGITANTGFTAADQTSPATNATGNPRGTYKVQSASDGTKVLQAYISAPIVNCNNMNLAYGVVPA